MATIDNLKYEWHHGDGAASSTPANEGAFSGSPKSWSRFSHCTRTPLSWMEELEKGALAIAESTNRQIWICSSGGIDSETLCEVFFKLKIPFKVLTVEYTGAVNAHDTVYARRWCEQHRVEQKIHELDLEKFVHGGELDEFIREGYLANELFRIMMIKHLALVEDMGGFGVLAGGEQLYHVDASKKVLTAEDPYLLVDITYTSPVEWCRRNGGIHEGYFFFSQPEIMLAWQRIPLIDFVLKNPDFFRHTTNRYALKNCVIRYHYPQQQWRNKYTGYEKVMDLYKVANAKLVNHFGASVEKYRLYVSELARQLEPIGESTVNAKKSSFLNFFRRS